jgi:hypothetical protein
MTMSDYEIELIIAIRNSKDPAKALELAFEIILGFLKPQETPEQPSDVSLPESA